MPGLVASVPPSLAPQTNTLILTPLPLPFFHPTVLESLRALLAAFASHDVGDLYAWAPLRGLRRVIVVFHTPKEAEDARSAVDGLVLDDGDMEGFVLRAYRGTPTPIIDIANQENIDPGAGYLKPPAADKNFLISPPGSPPIGWEQRVEDPPNVAPLAEDLIRALEKLAVMREEDSDLEISSSGFPKGVLISEHEGPGVGIHVEDWTDRHSHDLDSESDSEGDADADAEWAEEFGIDDDEEAIIEVPRWSNALSLQTRVALPPPSGSIPSMTVPASSIVPGRPTARPPLPSQHENPPTLSSSGATPLLPTNRPLAATPRPPLVNLPSD